MKYSKMILMADRRLDRCWSFEELVYLSWLTPGRCNLSEAWSLSYSEFGVVDPWALSVSS